MTTPQGQLQERPTPGVFSFYGLSAAATVPWF
ncbi:TPA: type I-F CRISPR-associated endoribonuclease Cas6/Csy4 [Serratia marcescens]|nr:type I-F CRISPR-associated endoribonuclease Cas6/Csy4 [Serratia marcescens]